jgi:hypothetical protein
MAATAPVKEIGYTQAVNYNWWLYENETTPELRWPQSMYVYDQMRRTDARSPRCCARSRSRSHAPRGASTRPVPGPEVVKLVADDLGLPIVGAEPSPAATDPGPVLVAGSPAPGAADAALRPHVLRAALPHRATRKRARLRKLAPRPPKTIDERIDVAPDGGLISITQYWSKTERPPAADPGEPARRLRPRSRGRQLARHEPAAAGLQVLAPQGPAAAGAGADARAQRHGHPALQGAGRRL